MKRGAKGGGFLATVSAVPVFLLFLLALGLFALVPRRFAYSFGAGA